MAEKVSKMNQKKAKKVKECDCDVKAITTALKAIPADQQLSMLLEKYAVLVEELKGLQTNMKLVDRQVVTLQKDKDHLESEHARIILAKSKLESLCRELQKQNKLIKEENLQRLREEEERRKEVSSKFNITLTEISNLMKENSDKNTKLRDENQGMAQRLQDLVKQYETREANVEKVVRQKELECQLSEAKLAKQQIEMTEEKEKMLLEKKSLLEEVAAYQKKTQLMSQNEITIRTQLNSYMEKYEDFQKTLEKSNDIFNTFKREMEEMAKKIKKTEKDTKCWKERWEGANKSLLEMVAERSLLEKQLDLQTKQNKQLQNLCRALQQQLTELRNKEKNKPASEDKSPEIEDAQCGNVIEESPTGSKEMEINTLQTEPVHAEEADGTPDSEKTVSSENKAPETNGEENGILVEEDLTKGKDMETNTLHMEPACVKEINDAPAVANIMPDSETCTTKETQDDTHKEDSNDVTTVGNKVNLVEQHAENFNCRAETDIVNDSGRYDIEEVD